MKILTSKLEGAALDWAVAKCEGYVGADNKQTYDALLLDINKETYHPSTNWSQGGPIIERECITLDLTDVLFDHDTDDVIELDAPEWWASMGDCIGRGSTPLIAAMRCYVASKLGDEVEIPAELL